MWPNHHSQPIFTSSPNSRLWGDGSDNQDFTNYPGDAPYQYSQTHTPILANVTPTFLERTATQGEPTIPSASVDQRVPSLSPQDLATNKPQRSKPKIQPNEVRNPKRVTQTSRYSPSDWEHHRSAIKEFYIVHDLSLEETREKMSETYGFKPPLVLRKYLTGILLIITQA